jgi:hypothetical protein
MTATIRRKIERARARSLDWMRATGGGDLRPTMIAREDIVQRRKVTRVLQRLELETTQNGWPGGPRKLVPVPVGTEEITYMVTVREWGLDEIARKAGANKTGKSRCGPIEVRIIGRKRQS